MAFGMAYLSRHLSTAYNAFLQILAKKYKQKVISEFKKITF